MNRAQNASVVEDCLVINDAFLGETSSPFDGKPERIESDARSSVEMLFVVFPETNGPSRRFDTSSAFPGCPIVGGLIRAVVPPFDLETCSCNAKDEWLGQEGALLNARHSSSINGGAVPSKSLRLGRRIIPMESIANPRLSSEIARLRRLRFELSTDVCHVHTEIARLVVEVRAPDLIKKVTLRHEPAL